MRYALIMRFGLATCLGVLLLGLGTGTGFPAGDAGKSVSDKQLTVVQDESSMERLIKSYLESKYDYDVEANMLEDDKDDLFLAIEADRDATPSYRITIDSQPSNTDKVTKVVRERCILINLYTGVTVKPARRAIILDDINKLNRDMLFSSIYLDDDGEIVCSWSLNVLKEGLPTEYVYDAIVRIENNWEDLYPTIKKDL